MSAHALKTLTRTLVAKEIDAAIETLVENAQASLDALRLQQGYVAGLRTALALQEQAYKEIGG